MGGGHQTRLCPDCARSNPAEGGADFPQARCHFSLNNPYEESNSSVILSFSPSYPVPPPICFSSILSLRAAVAQNSRLEFVKLVEPDATYPRSGGCFSTMGGNPLVMKVSEKVWPSGVEVTFGTLCRLELP